MILIVGPSPGDLRHLRGLGESVRVWPKGRRLRRLARVRAVLLVARFLTHGDKAEAERVFGRDCLRVVSGSLREVRRVAEELTTVKGGAR